MSYDKKFETRKISDNSDQVNEWFHKCKINQVPYVVVVLRKKYANITWDIINLETKHDNHFELLGENFINDLIVLFKKYAVKKSRYEVSCNLANYIDMPIETFNLIAAELYDLILLNMIK
jgi:hypothetical protein